MRERLRQVMWMIIIMWIIAVLFVIIATWIEPPRKIYRPVFNKEIIEAADNRSGGK